MVHMPLLSIIIPAYNNSRYLSECVRSVLSQDFRDIEVIIVDDDSTDDTPAVINALALSDSRVRAVRHSTNQGTLAARATGVEQSHGTYAMFIDQDDALRAETLSRLIQASESDTADIYHFGVQVEAANPVAEQASAGMTAFLTPQPRTIRGEAILQTQFAESQGFDWHLHHKMFRANLLRSAYHAAAHTRLLLSDDLYMNFIIDSLADCYVALPKSPWYIYHLGRGDTLGATLTVPALHKIALRDAKALRLVRQFAEGPYAPNRGDWNNRIADVRNRLIEHTMNEWNDNLPGPEQQNGLHDILSIWEPDAVCGELYRYVRDAAYAYLQQVNISSPIALNHRLMALEYLHMAQDTELRFSSSHSSNLRYREMKDIAEQHLRDSGLFKNTAGQRKCSLPHWMRSLFSK